MPHAGYESDNLEPMQFYNLRVNPQTGGVDTIAGTVHPLGSVQVVSDSWSDFRGEWAMAQDKMLRATATWRGLEIDQVFQAKEAPNAGFAVSLLATNKTDAEMHVRITLSAQLEVSDLEAVKLEHAVHTFSSAQFLRQTIEHQNVNAKENSHLTVTDPGFERSLNMFYLGANHLYLLSDDQRLTASPSLDRKIAPGGQAGMMLILQEEIHKKD